MHTIIETTVTTAIPLLLAALGGIICERSGVLNVGLEGFMLAGAFIAAAVGAVSSGTAGFFAAIGLGLVLGLLVGWIMVALRADQVVTGIAFNILMLGLTSYLLDVLTAKSNSALSPGTTTDAVPGLDSIPGFGALFDLHWIAYLTYALVPVTFVLVFRTRLGVILRACGEFAEGARASGINVVRVRIVATAVGSALAAMAGAYLVVGNVGVFQADMTDGRGYIALVVVILGRWRPYGALAAAAAFGLAEAMTYYLQVQGVGIPVELTLALPYLVSLIGIVAFSVRRTAGAPAEDGQPLYLSN